MIERRDVGKIIDRARDSINEAFDKGYIQGRDDEKTFQAILKNTQKKVIIPDDGNKYIVIRERTLKHWLYMLNSAHYWTMNLEDQFGMPNPDTDILEPIENLQDAIKNILKKEGKHAENH